MNPRERVFAALEHRKPDRVPRFEIWIDVLHGALGQSDPEAAYVNLGQDCVMMPTINPPQSNAWRDGVDEWGRVWRNGMFIDGYMAMGFERFFLRFFDDPAFVHRLMEVRTEWCIAMYQKAASLGADVVVLGDDSARGSGPMISPHMWREFVLPYHRRIVEAMDVPMIWHSDGDTEQLLPMAVEAGFVGIHGVDPIAGMDLVRLKREFGSIASCNSICEGMNPDAVLEMFRYEEEVGS